MARLSFGFLPWRRPLLLIGLLAGALLVASCSPTPAPTSPSASTKAPASTGPLVVAVSTEPDSLDPQATNDEASRVVTGGIFETLIDRDPQAQLVPKLATSWEPSGETTWQLKLRTGITFHDGAPFNAEAAAFSLNRIIDKDFKTQRASYIEGITGAKALDPTTLEITTEQPDPVLPVRLTSIPMVSPKAAALPDFSQKPVGTGPYRFVSWTKGQSIDLTRNDSYWGTPAPVKDVSIRIIPDRQTMLAALEAGEVDVVIGLLPEQIQLAPKALSVPATEFSYVAFNTKKPELADKRVRLALNYAIDKETLARSLYEGHARPNNAQNLAEGMLGYNPRLKPIPYDPEKAKQLLAEAGYPNGFELTIHAPIGRYLKGEETAEYIAAQLEQVGIRVKVNLMEWNAYRDAGRDKTQNPMDLKYGWNSSEWFDASRIEAHITCDGPSSKYCNPEVDELMAKAGSTLDQAERQRMYERVWEILHEDPYAIYLLQQNVIYGLSNRVEWTPRPDAEIRVAEMKIIQ